MLDTQSSQRLHNAFLCLPKTPIVFLSLPRVGSLPSICITSGYVPIYQILSRFYPRIVFLNTLNIDAKSGHQFLVSSSQLHIFLWYVYTLPYVSTAASRSKHTSDLSILWPLHASMLSLCKCINKPHLKVKNVKSLM